MLLIVNNSIYQYYIKILLSTFRRKSVRKVKLTRKIFAAALIYWVTASHSYSEFTDVEKRLLSDCKGINAGLGTSHQSIAEFIQLNPKSPVGPFLMGRFFRIDGQPSYAISFLDAAEKLLALLEQPDLRTTQILRAAILHERYSALNSLDQQESAENALRVFISSGYDQFKTDITEELLLIRTDIQGELFNCLLKQGKLEEASALLKANNIDTNDISARLNAARIDREARLLFRSNPGDEKVLILYREAIALLRDIHLKDSGLWATAAFHEKRSGNYSEAISLQRAILDVGGPEDLHLFAEPLAVWATNGLQWDEAIQKFALSRKQLAGRYAYIRENLEPNLRLDVAQFFLLHGDIDDALKHTKDLVDNPHRNFTDTNSLDYWVAGACITRAQALRLRGYYLTAASTNADVWKRIQIWWERIGLQTEYSSVAAQFRRSVFGQLSERIPPRDFLGLARVPEWLWPEVIHMIGLAEAQRLVESFPAKGRYGQRVMPWINTLLAYADKDWPAVLRHSQAAQLAFVGDGDAVLRMQTLLAQAESLRHLNRGAEAKPLYEQIARVCPGLVPIMEATLPLKSYDNIPSNIPFTASEKSGFRLLIATKSNVSKTPNVVTHQLIAADGSILRELELAKKNFPSLAVYETLFIGPNHLSDVEKETLNGRNLLLSR